MMRRLSTLLLSLLLAGFVETARADINLVNIDLGSSEARRAEELYGRAYGFPPMQVAPVMAAPAEELPAILKISQAAGTLPISVWMLRQAGMDYGQILQQFAVAPLVTMGQPVTNAYYINRARQNFLVDLLRVDPVLLPMIPLRGPAFTRFIVYPVHPKLGYWLPPGQAKKYGMWIPPGQAKKMGLWDGQWGHDRWRSWDWNRDDWKDFNGKGKAWKHDGGSKGKKSVEYRGPNGGKNKGGPGRAPKNSKGKGKGRK